ncbi:MAG: tripartite tricarboxylate transporter TctB family protein [Betaproteobacteria bacterium]|nr:tripartite tricarboxylate transporter TctB family protein [Betaproteobacteria bacterium]
MRIKSPKDFWAGLMFIAFGMTAMVIALMNYQFGTAVRMGPGYFPTVLGGILVALGVFVLFESLVIEGPKIADFHLRPLLLITVGLLAYGYLMQPLGLMLSTALMVFISAVGGHEFKWKEVTVLSVVLITFSVLVFVKGLTLPFPIWPAFME